MDIPNQESLTVEFKSDKRKLSDEDILESVVALANTDGGLLYLGVEDDGTSSGIHAHHRDITRLSAFIANNTVPPVATRAEILKDAASDLEVISIEVPRSTSIVATASGKMLRRRIKGDGTPESVPMYPHEITTRLSSLEKLDYSALPVSDFTVADLDQNEVMRLRDIVASSLNADKTLLGLNDEELLGALRLMVEDGGKVPTVAGALLLGGKRLLEKVLPTHGASFQVLTGTEVRVNQDFNQPLLYVIQQMDRMLEAWNPEREYFEGLFRLSVPEFDRRAFRESLVNAFGHRDYSILGRVLVQITDEGMAISNPGGLVEGVTIDNLLSVEPHSRNPVLMNALKRIGLAETTGRGIDRIYEGSLMYGRPLPDWTGTTASSVKLFIARSSPDEAFMQLLEEERQKTGTQMSVRSMLILDELKHQRRLSCKDLAEALHMPDGVVRSIVERFVETGILEAVGDGRNRAYVLSARVYARKGNVHAHTLQTGIDRIRYAELVMKLAEQQGSIANRDVVELLHIGDKQAYAVLRTLKNKGKLLLKGKGAGAKYYPATTKEAK